MGAGRGSQFSRKNTKVGELTVHYLQGGQGKPLLYIHGIGGWGRWETHHLGMGVTNEVYAPQLPGWQMGKLPSSVTSVRDYAEIMVRFLDTLQIESAHLVGHSIGGWVALYMATQHPERIARLILVDPLGLEVPAHPTANFAELDEETFLTAAFAKTGVVLIAGDFGGLLEDVQTGQEFKRQWKGRGLVAALPQGHSTDPEITQNLKHISAPTLVVWGREDGLVPWQQGEMLTAEIPNAKLVVIADASHSPMREKRETFQHLVHSFLIGQKEDGETNSTIHVS